MGGLGAMYNDHLRLNIKHVGDFLLVLIELLLLGATAEALRANIGSKSAILFQQGPVDPKFQVEGVACTTILFLRKLYKNLDRFFFWIVTIYAFDGQTNRRTDRIFIARPHLHFMQCGKYTINTHCCINKLMH